MPLPRNRPPVQGFKGSRLEVEDLLQPWTVDTFALKGESMRMERFEEIKGVAVGPRSKLQGFWPQKEG